MAKIYNTLQRNRIEPKTEKILTKNRNSFRRNLETTILFINFPKAFNSIHRGKMEQILLVHGLHKETVTLYKNTKVKFTSLDGDTDYCDIVAGVLQGDTLTPPYGRAKAGRPSRTHIQQLCTDTGSSLGDLPGAMDDRDGWRERAWKIRASSVS